ncbi:MAG: helix-turn-helix transcriptional regulator [Clostridia bacterium]|nr:helix-turn-helix transcriptional regulator [Clostridia bacterium]
MSYYELPADAKGYYHYADFVGTRGECHFHAAPEIVFVTGGVLDVTVGGDRRTLHAGEGCFSDGFCLHGYAESDTTRGYVLLGEGCYFERVFSLFDGCRPPRFFTFRDTDVLHLLDGSFEKEPLKDPADAAFFAGVLSLLLSSLARDVPFAPKRTDRKEELICDVLTYASENLARDLSLGALSARFGYSREHLSRLLGKYLSENWNSYLGRLRARRAHKLITGEGCSVTEAALAAGFSSLNTFYRAYEREFGAPPVRK